MTEVTEIPQEQSENMNEILLKLIELMGAIEEIFYQIDIVDRLSNARNAAIIKLSSVSSRDRFLFLKEIIREESTRQGGNRLLILTNLIITSS